MNSDDVVLSTDNAEQKIKNAKELLQKRQYRKAVDVVNVLLESQADNVEGQYILGVCQRYLNETDKALETVEQIKTLSPMYARAYQEEGHNHRSIGNVAAAIAAYEQAVTFNPALIASWKALSDLYSSNGDSERAAQSRGQFLRLSKIPPELISVASMIHEGKLYKAEKLCRIFLQRNPHHIEAMRLLAEIGVKLYVLDDAEFLLQSCVEFAPDYRLARYDYVNVLHKRQKYELAREQARILCETDPGNLPFEILFASQCLMVGDFDTALDTYNEAVKKNQNDSHAWLVRGHALKTLGRQKESIGSYKTAIREKPAFGDAYWSLANLKVYEFSDAELGMMHEHESNPLTSQTDRIHLCFALGKCYEDRHRFNRSFRYYDRGNALRGKELRYSADRTEAEFKSQIEVGGTEFFNERIRTGCQSNDPIFIVGLPRAGSTLLEQILASHSQVDGTMELPNILALAHRLNGRRLLTEETRYPGILRELPSEKLKQFGEEYIQQTQIYRKGSSFFVDKMPNNFRHIALIQLILPNAKIIDARRHPIACCFSGFKQLFSEGQAFTYSQEDVGRYYKGYVELMEHWDEMLPNKILRVQHEEVVADLEAQVRSILDFCGLPFEEECLSFYKTERPVRTASSEQVRQPIYAEGLEQWRNFESHLGVLKETLGPELRDTYSIS